jgi:hypothetical protein
MKALAHFVNQIGVWVTLAVILTAGQISAQPRITLQPRDVAVFLGSNATFRVTATATGAAPLSYQWRFDGQPLANATNSSLVLSNVLFSDLGGYHVVVRNAAGETSSRIAWLKLARFSNMVVFGNSHTMSSFSNGRSWVDYLQEYLGFPNDRLTNYSVGGADILRVRTQIQDYLKRYTPSTNTLLAPFWAYGDVSDEIAVQRYISNYVANISLLANAGGRIFLLTTPPPLAAAGVDQAQRTGFDAALWKFQADYGATVFRFDLYDMAKHITADPLAYGFTNIVDPAIYCGRCDANKYFWWDRDHLTTVAHRVTSEQMLALFKDPLVLHVAPEVTGANMQFHWEGGLPPFRVQFCADLLKSDWEGTELTFERTAELAAPSRQRFFRVLQLGQ